jgi:hypothetical protein
MSGGLGNKATDLRVPHVDEECWTRNQHWRERQGQQSRAIWELERSMSITAGYFVAGCCRRATGSPLSTKYTDIDELSDLQTAVARRCLLLADLASGRLPASNAEG